MFCPQCGQQQASGEVRFCSRCGFQLDSVNSLLLSGGVAPVLSAAPAVPYEESPRRKGARLGGKLMLFGIFLMPMMAIMHELFGVPDELPLLGVLFFLGGLLRIIYAVIFEQGPFRQPKFTHAYYPPLAQLTQTPRAAAELPPGQNHPIRAYVPPRHDTSEIAYRPSVTESTTRLLGDQEDERRR